MGVWVNQERSLLQACKTTDEGKGGRERDCFAASEGISLVRDWILISLSNRDNLDNKGENYIRAKMP